MKVSVVTPTLNSEKWMPACIGSVKMQAVAGLEVEHVIADGGSTDRTVELAEEAGCTVVRIEDDRGIFDATNKGTRASTGDLVGFLGCDDALMPGGLEALARRYQASGRRWVTGSYLWTDEHFRSLGTIVAPPEWLTAEMQAVLGWSYPLHMATYVERSLYDELGGFDLDFPVAADYKFFTECLRVGPFAREPQVVAVFRRHGGNESMVDPATGELARIAEAYGPANPLQRAALRTAIKSYVNARNPGWSYRKRRALGPVPGTLATV